MDESVLVINSSITIDETDGFAGQGNEIDPASLVSNLSVDLFAYLTGLGFGDPENVSLQSGMISTPDGSSDLSWSDASGEPLLNEPAGFQAYDPNSDAVEDVVLNTDTNNNLLIGTTTSGTVVFVAIIDDATGSQTTHDVYLITYLPLIHDQGDGTSLSLDVSIAVTADLTFDDFSDAPSGANDWLTFGDSSGGVQLLATSDPYETGPDEADNSKVNTSTIGLGADSQSVAVDSMVRIDLVSGSLSGADLSSTLTNDASALDYTQHEETREYQFGLVQTGGNAANRVDARVAIFFVDDSAGSTGYSNTADFFADSTDGIGETSIAISRIEVIDTRSGTETVVSSWTPGGGEVTPTGGDAEVDYILNGDGSVDVDDVIEGYAIRVYADSDFNRIETTNVSDNPKKNGTEGSVANKTFDIGAIEVGGITGDVDPATLVFLDDEPTAEGGGDPILRYEDLFETPFKGNDEDQEETGAPSLLTLINEGADQPVTFSLNIDTGSLPSLTSGGDPISYMVDTSDLNFDILTASTTTTVVFTVKVFTNGDVEITFDAPLDHSQDLQVQFQPDGDELEVDLTDLLQGFDRDNDAVTFLDKSLVLRFQDDAPEIVTAGTPDALTVDESDFGNDATADYSDNFTPSFGGDGPAAVGVTYALSIGTAGASTGLMATVSGEAVILTFVGGVIIAETETSGEEVFRVSVADDGEVTLDQSLAVVHTPNNGPDDMVGLMPDSIILTATAEDADEDTASVPLDISGAITLVDDAPEDPTVVITNDNFLAVTYDGGLAPDGNFVGAGGAGDRDPSPVVAEIDLSNHFTFGNLDATGNDGGTNTAGYALALLGETAEGDPSGLTSNGSAINLFINDTGTKVTGSTAADEQSVSGANTVFTLELTGSLLMLTQLARIDHEVNGTYNGVYLGDVRILADGLVGVVASAQITDGDGDASNLVSQTLDLGGNVAFGDDGPDNPVVSLSGTEPLLKTFDGGLAPDGNFVGAELTPEDTNGSPLIAEVDFSVAFDVVGDDNGADGEGATTTTYALALAVAGGTSSGLTSGGAAVNLFDIDGVIYGSTAVAGASDGDVMAAAVFTLAVGGSSGMVTQTQSGPIDQDTGEAYSGSYIDDTATLATGLVNLVATAVTTDSEGDTSTTKSNALDMGGNVIFGDDGPTLTTSGTLAPLQVDETELGTDATANYAVNFAPLYGADGMSATVQTSYALSVTNTASGLVATASGLAVVLGMENNDVVGIAGGVEVLRISVDDLGTVTLDQKTAVEHDPDTGPDQVVAMASGSVGLTAVATDADGDTASALLDVSSVVSFRDDTVDVLTIDGGVVKLMVDQTASDDSFVDYGADGNGGLIISSFESMPDDSILGPITEDLSTDKKTLTYYTSGETGLEELFVLQVNDDGSYVFTVKQGQPLVLNPLDFGTVSPGGPKELETVSGAGSTFTTFDGFLSTNFNGDALGEYAAGNLPGNTLADGPDDVNISTPGVGLDDNQMDPDEQLRLSFSEDFAGLISKDVEGVQVVFDGGTGGGSTFDIRFASFDDGLPVDDFVYNNEDLPKGSTSLTLDYLPGDSFDELYIFLNFDGNNNGVRIKEVSLFERQEAPDFSLDYTLKASDGDADMDVGSFTIDIDGNSDGFILL